MKQWNWRAAAPLAVLALALGGPLRAELRHDRGTISSTNWGTMQMGVENEKGKVKTWGVARDCVVKFSDEGKSYKNPKLGDLKPSMYVHFMYEGSDGDEVIQNIDVKDVPYDPAAGGPGVQQKGVVSNFDMDKGHLEVALNPGGKTTFEVDPKKELAGVQKGDSVRLLIETRSGHEVVTKITKEGGGKVAAKDADKDGKKKKILKP